MAVAAVVLYHAQVPFLSGGYVGVDIFFVISGFLITQHLSRSLESEGRIRFGSFYARRARRILPASFVVLVLTLVAAFIWLPPLQLVGALREATATALYVPNLLFAAEGTNYLAEDTPSIFQHYWSLGVEEQFYLAWPALLGIAFVVGRTRRALIIVVIAVTALAFVSSIVVAGISQPWAFFSAPTRAWEFGVGGLAALIGSRVVIPKPGVASVGGWAGMLGIIVAITLYNDQTPFPGTAAVLPVLSTVALLMCETTGTRWGPGRVLATRPFQFIGLTSYSLYLVHWPLVVVPQGAVGYLHPLPLWATLGLSLLAVPAAYLLHRLVETRAQTAPWLALARPARTLGLALRASLVVLAITVVATGVVSNLRLDDGQRARDYAATNPPEPTGYVPSNLVPSLKDSADDNPVLYEDGCHVNTASVDPSGCSFGDDGEPTIALFGDSHAAQWFPALESFSSENGYRIETHTKSSCPSVAVPIDLAGTPYEACREWREAVIAELRSNPPAVVVLANYGRVNLTDETADYSSAWQSGLEKTISALKEFTEVVVIADTPDLGQTPSICLSAHLGSTVDCTVSADRALDAPSRAAEIRAVARTGATLVDLTPYLCSSSACPPILGNVLVYRDAHHITATFSRAVSGVLSAQMTPLLSLPSEDG